MTGRGDMTDTATADPTSQRATRIDAVRLRRFTHAVFEQAGMPSEDAEIMAEHLVWADLRDIAALGVAKIPQYLSRLREGGTAAVTEPTVLAERSGFLAIDGHDGFGQVVAYKVMRQVSDRARATGVSAAVVRNTTSAGALGRFASLAVESRLIGLAINNGPALMRAPGGAERVLGNQAFAIASPAGRHAPVVFDTALSAIALARVHEYEQRGETLPEGLALTAEGAPTVDPAEALNGILGPMGGHRGFGLAFMWEILTGILSGGSAFSTDLGWPADGSKPQCVSMLLLAIDPLLSMPYADYLARVDALVDRMHASRPAEGSERVTVPGERSVATMANRESEGIPVPASLLGKLTSIGEAAGVSL